ncbi:MAG TPA: type II secretion system minor pseudopilin GspI [Steroidobacteraceae bacterium]|jgi:general secretion pathway protein I|nr:type II secretion system minor pseudopilin GspI [Steroidobacteraceae bacterium]
MTCRPRTAGFTLIEVLVALVIVAFGMGALLATLSSAADTAGSLRDKSFAQWIAMNRITEIRLRGDRPAVAKTSGDVEFAGQKWRWYQEVLDPGIAGMLRIDVSVARAGPATAKNETPPALALATGFVGTAVVSGTGNDPDWSPWTRQSTAPPPAPKTPPASGLGKTQ